MPVTHTVLAHACAECKRLKLKCDKQKPCSACVRRGCPEVCPEGSLVPGKGTRFILSNTKELHDEIDGLRARVKELEQALGALQSQLTPEPHPLLKESLKVVSQCLSPVEQGVKVEEEETVIDTFGSLTIDRNGQTTWYGPHAGSEFFIPREHDNNANATNDPPHTLPIDMLLLGNAFPFKTVIEAETDIRKRVRAWLPPKDTAYTISHAYHSRLSWSTSPHFWTDFMEEVFDPIYADIDKIGDDRVALMFVVLACSCLLDPERPANPPEARQFFHLSKVSIMLGEDLFQSRSTFVIQYLQYMAFYYGLSNDPKGPNKAWVATSMAIRLAQMAGLHRDNAKWDEYPEIAERRRRLWWELLSYETMQGFAMGRPRAVSLAHWDTKLPKDDEDEGKPPSFNRVKYRWIIDSLGRVLDEAFAVKPPPYATILKLDKQIRDWPLDSVPSMEDVCGNTPLELDHKFMIMLMRSFATTGLREISLMYLHRRYFVESLTKRPEEPLRSKYAMSVLAVHRSAVLLLQGLQRLDGIIGRLLPKVIFMWLHGLSAYVCLCAIVIKSPGCSLSRSCLVEIDRTKDLFARITAYRLSHTQPVIRKLYEQAHLAMNLFREGKWPPEGPEEKLEDVMRFAGRSGFVSADRDDSSDSTPEATPTALSPDAAHPMLSEYMKRFESDSTTPGQSSEIGFPPEQTFTHWVDIYSGNNFGLNFTDSTSTSVMTPTSSSLSPTLDQNLNLHSLGSPTNGINGVSGINGVNGAGGSFTFDPNKSSIDQSIYPIGWSPLFQTYQEPVPGLGLADLNSLQAQPDLLNATFNDSSGDPFTFDATFVRYQPTGPQPDQVWDQFVSGLIPLDGRGESNPTS